MGRRLDTLIATEPHDTDARRLLKRLRRTGDHLFTFLDYPQIPFENSFAERRIRPAVIPRKNSQSNRSDRGAATQAVLMSICRTLRLRGHDPLQTIADAPRTYLQTGQLPPLPTSAIVDGWTVTDERTSISTQNQSTIGELLANVTKESDSIRTCRREGNILYAE